MRIYLAGEDPPTVDDADRNGNILIRSTNGMFAERPWDCDLDENQEWAHTFFWQ